MHLFTRRSLLRCLPVILATALLGGELRAESAPVFWPENATEDGGWTGRLVHVDDHLAILTVRGGPAERGIAHGKLLRAQVAQLIKCVRAYLTPEAKDGNEHYQQCLAGARTMGKFVDADVMTELKACAAAAGVDSDELLLAQLFGDVNRAAGFTSYCSSFAAFGEATVGGNLLVGRNFDYAGHGLEGGLPLILQELPTGERAGRPFVTLCYAGILNGWTSMNADGVCASNNTLFGGTDSLEGMSTCFLLRKIVEQAKTIEEGVAIIEKTPRACTTGMLVAGKNSKGAWDARFVEYDAKSSVVIEPQRGIVLATNKRQLLPAGGITPPKEVDCSRYKALKAYLTERLGKLSFDDKTQNPVGQKDVYLSINLHCALLDPAGQRIRAAFADGDGKPAGEKPFRDFEVKANVVVPQK